MLRVLFCVFLHKIKKRGALSMFNAMLYYDLEGLFAMVPNVDLKILWLIYSIIRYTSLNSQLSFNSIILDVYKK